LKKLTLSFILLLVTISLAVVGYYFVEGMSLFDSFYMAIITISTVGFQEVVPLSKDGRIITIIFILLGVSLGAYTLGTFIRMFIEGELKKSYGRRKVETKITKLSNHYIICGFGRIGSIICQDLYKSKKPFVVIENNLKGIEKLNKKKYLYLPLDATKEESLIAAQIDKAKTLVTVVKSDSDNVFITLTARGIRPDIFILARSSNEKDGVKIKRAGANKVISPYIIGGKRMAQVLLKPAVVDFIDTAIMENQFGLQIEEMKIKPKSKLIGKNLIESNLRNDFGVIIVSMRKENGHIIFNPKPTEIIEANDIIVILGEIKEMFRMNKML